MSEVVWQHADGDIRVTELGDDRRRVEADVRVTEHLARCSSIETTYPLDLIRAIFEAKGPVWVCDDIRVGMEGGRWRMMEKILFAYVSPDTFRGKAILEFGCGTGATMIHAARLFPEARFIGIELLSTHLKVARQRVRHHGLGNVSFMQSPSGSELPEELGPVDMIILPAVYEHMLPAERRRIFPLLWSLLRPGGVLFIMETPNRWWVSETHTTKLPFLNYLPPRPALRVARRFSKRVTESEAWDALLRRGIRGGSVGELRRILRGDGSARPVFLKPRNGGFRTRSELCWCRNGRPRGLKRAVVSLISAAELITGCAFVPDLELAIAKPAAQPGSRRDDQRPA